MRAWRYADGFLVEDGRSDTPVVSPLYDLLPPGSWRDCMEFGRLDQNGNWSEKYLMTTCSLEEDLSISVNAVVDGALRHLFIVLTSDRSMRVERQETVVLDGLVQLAPGDPDWAKVEAGVAARRANEAGKAEERRRAADARIATIPGADKDLGRGPRFRQVQRALRDDVWAHGDYGPLPGEMLRVLLRFGALVGRHPALEEFMLACHEIAPAAGHHRAEVVSPDPIDDPAAGRPLVETLERLQSDLRAEGDRLDLADQRLNAISYFDAAKHVANARALLAAALQSG